MGQPSKIQFYWMGGMWGRGRGGWGGGEWLAGVLEQHAHESA
jgi:hypothetical protein